MWPCPDWSSACDVAAVMVAVAFVGWRSGVNVVPLASVIVLGSVLVAVVDVGPVPEPTVTTSTVFAFEKGIVITVGGFLAVDVVVSTRTTAAVRLDAFESMDDTLWRGDDTGWAGITWTRDRPMGTKHSVAEKVRLGEV